MKRYIVEVNRAVGDSIRKAAARLRRMGFQVAIVPHKTTLVVCRPRSVSWQAFKASLKAIIQPRRGSILVFSESTGRSFFCQNAGNAPGRFQRI